MQFLTIFAKLCTQKSFKNHKIAELNSCRVWDSLFPNIWSKYDIDDRISHISTNSVGTGRKLNVHKTFRKRLRRLLNVLCTFNLCPVSTGYGDEIRVSATYLITITLINNRKNDVNEISFFHFIEIAKWNTREMFSNHQITQINARKMAFFPLAKLSIR